MQALLERNTQDHAFRGPCTRGHAHLPAWLWLWLLQPRCGWWKWKGLGRDGQIECQNNVVGGEGPKKHINEVSSSWTTAHVRTILISLCVITNCIFCVLLAAIKVEFVDSAGFEGTGSCWVIWVWRVSQCLGTTNHHRSSSLQCSPMQALQEVAY